MMAKTEVIERLRKFELQLLQAREFSTQGTSAGYWETLTRVDVGLNELMVDALKESYRAKARDWLEVPGGRDAYRSRPRALRKILGDLHGPDAGRRALVWVTLL